MDNILRGTHALAWFDLRFNQCRNSQFRFSNRLITVQNYSNFNFLIIREKKSHRESRNKMVFLRSDSLPLSLSRPSLTPFRSPDPSPNPLLLSFSIRFPANPNPDLNPNPPSRHPYRPLALTFFSPSYSPGLSPRKPWFGLCGSDLCVLHNQVRWGWRAATWICRRISSLRSWRTRPGPGKVVTRRFVSLFAFPVIRVCRFERVDLEAGS